MRDKLNWKDKRNKEFKFKGEKINKKGKDNNPKIKREKTKGKIKRDKRLKIRTKKLLNRF
jgi:hypothetical protein